MHSARRPRQAHGTAASGNASPSLNSDNENDDIGDNNDDADMDGGLPLQIAAPIVRASVRRRTGTTIDAWS